MGERLSVPLEQKNPKNIDYIKTHLDGVYLRVVKGKKVNMSPETIEEFHSLANAFAPSSHAESELESENTILKGKLKAISRRFKNFRGMVSETGAWNVTATRSTKQVPVREVLREELGAAYHSFVSEAYEAKINVPHGTLTSEGEPIEAETIRNAFITALSNIGLSTKQIGEIVTDKIKLRVNKKALQKAKKKEEIEFSLDAFELSQPKISISSELIT